MTKKKFSELSILIFCITFFLMINIYFNFYLLSRRYLTFIFILIVNFIRILYETFFSLSLFELALFGVLFNCNLLRKYKN